MTVTPRQGLPCLLPSTRPPLPSPTPFLPLPLEALCPLSWAAVRNPDPSRGPPGAQEASFLWVGAHSARDRTHDFRGKRFNSQTHNTFISYFKPTEKIELKCLWRTFPAERRQGTGSLACVQVDANFILFYFFI